MSDHPSMFVWCDDCQLPRLRSIEACPVCQSRRVALCACGRFKMCGLCPHCDTGWGSSHEDGCEVCLGIMAQMGECKTEYEQRPHPTPAELHDLERGAVPAVGAVGRCRRCGGRNYRTNTGVWCPRAFCDGQTQTAA